VTLRERASSIARPAAPLMAESSSSTPNLRKYPASFFLPVPLHSGRDGLKLSRQGQRCPGALQRAYFFSQRSAELAVAVDRICGRLLDLPNHLRMFPLPSVAAV